MGELTAGLAIGGCSDYSSGAGLIMDLEMKVEDLRGTPGLLVMKTGYY